jgi:hypothetical protein
MKLKHICRAATRACTYLYNKSITRGDAFFHVQRRPICFRSRRINQFGVWVPGGVALFASSTLQPQMNSSARRGNSNRHQTDLGEVDEIAKATAPVENNVLTGVVGGGGVDGFGTGKLDKSAAFADVNVAGSNSSSGFLHGTVIGEKVLAVATGSEDGNRAECRVGIKPDGINKLKQGLRWGGLVEVRFKADGDSHCVVVYCWIDVANDNLQMSDANGRFLAVNLQLKYAHCTLFEGGILLTAPPPLSS